MACLETFFFYSLNEIKLCKEKKSKDIEYLNDTEQITVLAFLVDENDNLNNLNKEHNLTSEMYDNIQGH